MTVLQPLFCQQLVISSYIAFLLFFAVVRCDDNPIVEIQQGQVQGNTLTSTKGRTFYVFRGIPYAQPPVDNLRFKEPLPAEPWEGVFIADTDGPACLQFDALTYHIIFGQEDCLHVNVYTPSVVPQVNVSLLPVMVFFYGGGFGEGADTFAQYGPHRFMDYDMLVVALNYRLGALGFLSTGDFVQPGNNGLLDQLLALRWIHDNIAAFGGDPNKVTLQGQSAGAASVIYHIVSPASKGLFHQAILESGSALCPWAMQLDPVPWAHKLADKFQCSTNDSTSLIGCLQEVPGVEFVYGASSLNNFSWLTLPFLPVIEDPAYGKFITENPMITLESGNFNRVPTLTGVNKDEGSMWFGETASYFQVIDDNFFTEILPAMLSNFTHFKYNFLNMSYAIKDEYFSNIDLQNSSQVARAATDMYTDGLMNSPTETTAQLLTNWSIPVYKYRYEYVGDLYLTNFTGQPEVAHTAELLFIFNASFVTLSDRDNEDSNTLVQMWSNFVIYGDPNPTGSAEWIATTVGETPYLDIKDDLAMIDSFLPQQMWFWNEYLPTIGGSPYY